LSEKHLLEAATNTLHSLDIRLLSQLISMCDRDLHQNGNPEIGLLDQLGNLSRSGNFCKANGFSLMNRSQLLQGL